MEYLYTKRAASLFTYHIARGNIEVAKSLSNVFKSYMAELIPGIDFRYDAPTSGVRGMNEAAFSFPARPREFDEEDLNGTILVRGNLNPPVQETGKGLVGFKTKLTFEIGFYFKTPRLPGNGKYMFQTPAGTFDIEFNEEGQPVVQNEEEVVALTDAYSALSAKVMSETPEGARRLTPKDPHEQKVQREQNDEAERFEREKSREKQQHQEIRDQQDANSSTHGSEEAFVQYMQDQEETSFGPGDLQKLLDTKYSDKNSRLMMRNEVINKLKELGLKWDPSKRTIASFEIHPDSVALELRFLAALIDSNVSPSIGLVRERLAALHSAIGPEDQDEDQDDGEGPKRDEGEPWEYNPDCND